MNSDSGLGGNDVIVEQISSSSGPYLRKGSFIHSSKKICSPHFTIQSTFAEELTSAFSLSSSCENISDSYIDSNELTREEVDVTVKLFFENATKFNKEDVSKLVTELFNSLNIKFIDTLILSVNSSFNLDNLLCVWQCLEAECAKGHIINLGVSDIDFEQFKYLIQSVKIQPSLLQLSSSSSSINELLSFSKENKIRVISNSDHNTELPKSNDIIFSQTEDDEDAPVSNNVVEAIWAARVHQSHKSRSILLSKGYFVKAKYEIV
jgi:diketogulonate reductase-like aldo/keto reductase